MSRQDTRQTVAPVGARIREAQQAKGLTNRSLADQLDVDVRLLQKWKAGTMPSYANLVRLARALDHSVSWFFSTDGEMTDEAVA